LDHPAKGKKEERRNKERKEKKKENLPDPLPSLPALSYTALFYQKHDQKLTIREGNLEGRLFFANGSLLKTHLANE